MLNTKGVIFTVFFLYKPVKTKKTAQNGTHGIPLLLNLIMLRIIEQRIKVQKFAEPAENCSFLLGPPTEI